MHYQILSSLSVRTKKPHISFDKLSYESCNTKSMLRKTKIKIKHCLILNNNITKIFINAVLLRLYANKVSKCVSFYNESKLAKTLELKCILGQG